MNHLKPRPFNAILYVFMKHEHRENIQKDFIRYLWEDHPEWVEAEGRRQGHIMGKDWLEDVPA